MSWKRLLGYAFVFFLLVPTWFILGGVNHDRSRDAEGALSMEVSSLFGGPVTFRPPKVTRQGVDEVVSRVKEDDAWVDQVELVPYAHPVGLQRHHLLADVGEERRNRGLVSFRLFTVDAAASWAFTSSGDPGETMRIGWRPPQVSMIEDFEVRLEGEPVQVDLQEGTLWLEVPAAPARQVVMDVDLRTRGRDRVGYADDESGLATLRDVDVRLRLDQDDHDLPMDAASPTRVIDRDGGVELLWVSDTMITDRSFEASFADPMQPGELAARLAWAAPWSLALFVSFIGALVVVRDIDVHPIHLVLTGMGFFAFNLLFSYLVDVVGVGWAFAVSAAVSVFLVTTYLSQAVSPAFGYRQAGVAQLVFLVGFALANVWEGMTGLSITVTGIVTLWAIMRITAKVDWTRALSRDKVAA